MLFDEFTVKFYTYLFFSLHEADAFLREWFFKGGWVGETGSKAVGGDDSIAALNPWAPWAANPNLFAFRVKRHIEVISDEEPATVGVHIKIRENGMVVINISDADH